MRAIVLLIVVILLLAGCDSSGIIQKQEHNRQYNPFQELTPITFCKDSVICYYYDGGYDGGMSCFRDADLVEKYCV